MSMIRSARLSYGLSAVLGDFRLDGTERAYGGVVYVCPDNKVAILREILISSVVGGPHGSTLWWIQPSGASAILIWCPETASAYTTDQLVCDAVLRPGDEIVMATDLADVAWYVSGAELFASGEIPGQRF